MSSFIAAASSLLSPLTLWGSSRCSPVHPSGAPLEGCWHAPFPTRLPSPRAEMSSFRFPLAFRATKSRVGRMDGLPGTAPAHLGNFAQEMAFRGLWEPSHWETKAGGGWMAWGPVAGP